MVGTGGYGDEVLGVVQIVGVKLLAFGWPILISALVGVAQGYHVVDV